MAKDFSNQEIAQTLFVSLNTIKTHAARIFEKWMCKEEDGLLSKEKEAG